MYIYLCSYDEKLNTKSINFCFSINGKAKDIHVYAALGYIFKLQYQFVYMFVGRSTSRCFGC